MLIYTELPTVLASTQETHPTRLGMKRAPPGVLRENPPQRFRTCDFVAMDLG